MSFYSELEGDESDTEDPTIYTLGTLIAGTERSMEDSISGYTPVVWNNIFYILALSDAMNIFVIIKYF